MARLVACKCITRERLHVKVVQQDLAKSETTVQYYQDLLSRSRSNLKPSMADPNTKINASVGGPESATAQSSNAGERGTSAGRGIAQDQGST